MWVPYKVRVVKQIEYYANEQYASNPPFGPFTRHVIPVIKNETKPVCIFKEGEQLFLEHQDNQVDAPTDQFSWFWIKRAEHGREGLSVPFKDIETFLRSKALVAI